jgi:hypothetical protein
MEVWLVGHFNHIIHEERDPGVHWIEGFMGAGLYMVIKKISHFLLPEIKCW